MIWLIIGLVVAIAIIIVGCVSEEWYTIGEKIGCSIAVLLTSFVCSMAVLCFASAIVSAVAEIEYNVVSDTKIIALKDNQNVNGNFYIMGGYVDEDLYYYYAVETEFGYKTEKIKAENAYIKYTDGEAHIERCDAEFVNDDMRFWGACTCDDRYIIYCPEGTVANEFEIDLE